MTYNNSNNNSNNDDAPSFHVLQRGYSVFPSTGKPSIQGASTYQNVLIKTRLPARGVVSSNPKRVERFLATASKAGLLCDIQEHTNVGWGVTIYTCTYKTMQLFVAGVPMGSAGSGFAFFEMFAAGAQAIIRYGSNDRQVTMDDLNTLVVVDQADNLVGLCHGSGRDEVTAHTVLSASDTLVNLLSDTIAQTGLESTRMICHNVEDYHAYNFSQLFVEQKESIHRQIESLEKKNNTDRADCWDMETAALFWRAQQFGCHAATVLQNLIKKPGTTSPYDGRHGQVSLAMEPTLYHVILEALFQFQPVNSTTKQAMDDNVSFSKSYRRRRSCRRFSSNDFLGVEEPLLLLVTEEDNTNAKATTTTTTTTSGQFGATLEESCDYHTTSPRR